MKKNEELIKKVLKFLSKQGASTNQEMTEKIEGSSFVTVATTTKLLLSEKLIAFDKETKKYSCLESKTEDAAKTNEKAIDKVFDTPEQETENEKPAKKGTTLNGKGKRDFSKFKFKFMGQEQEFSKSRLLLAIITQYVKDHNPTLTELKEAFPDESVKPYGYGTFRTEKDANAINSAGRQRFFTKENELIKIKSGGKLAVTNQVTSVLMTRFLLVAKKHKYTVR